MSRLYFAYLSLLCLLVVITATAEPNYRPDRLLARPRQIGAVAAFKIAKPKPHVRVMRSFETLRQLQVIEVPSGRDPLEMARELNASGWYEFAEPDYHVHAAALPNDPRLLDGTQYGLLNVAKPSADIDAATAWDLLHDATNIIVAVIDSGIRTTHEDLKDNLWRNPKEVAGDGVDNDHNGYVDDINGMSTVANAKGIISLEDEYGHGTHLSGIIGGTGNNGLGVVGVAWRAQIMTCRFLDATGGGSISDAVTCIDYARKMGARVINASWNGPDDSIALYTAILASQEAGIIFITAAGNEKSNNDILPVYPGNYTLPSILTVTASTRDDTLWIPGFGTSGSNFGTNSVHLAAPGQAISSTYNSSDASYQTLSGSSLATAYVSGAAALILARFPYLNPTQVADRILKSVDVLPALKGKVKTGGRLNLARALKTIPAFDLRVEIMPRLPATLHYTAFPLFSPVVLESTSDFSSWQPVWTNVFTTPPPWSAAVPANSGIHPFFRLRAP